MYTGWFDSGHLGQVVFIQRCFIIVECMYTGWFNGGHLEQVVFIQRCFTTVECILDGSIVVT